MFYHRKYHFLVLIKVCLICDFNRCAIFCFSGAIAGNPFNVDREFLASGKILFILPYYGYYDYISFYQNVHKMMF